jgi:hypothetical protein
MQMKMKDDQQIFLLELIRQHSLRELVIDARVRCNIASEGCRNGIPKKELKEKLPLLEREVALLLNIFDLPRNWAVTFYSLILFGDPVPPDPRITMEYSDKELQIVIKERISRTALTSYLKSEGVKDRIDAYLELLPRYLPNKAAFSDHLIRLEIWSQKQKKVPARDIIKHLKCTFAAQLLPRQIQLDDTQYVEEEYKKIKKSLKRYERLEPLTNAEYERIFRVICPGFRNLPLTEK